MYLIKIKQSEITLDIRDVFKLNIRTIYLVLGGRVCTDNKTIKSCLKSCMEEYTNAKFYAILGQSTPKDLVLNFRCIQKLNGTYIENTECVICLDKKPNIVGSECYHDSVLCSTCSIKIDKCPICFSQLENIEAIWH